MQGAGRRTPHLLSNTATNPKAVLLQDEQPGRQAKTTASQCSRLHRCLMAPASRQHPPHNTNKIIPFGGGSPTHAAALPPRGGLGAAPARGVSPRGSAQPLPGAPLGGSSALRANVRPLPPPPAGRRLRPR